MLELKNITKIYKPKKGVPVTALNGVNLKLGDTGMVFILGKSGSGKSTLLNILGGLDTLDSGEFLINGNSVQNYSQSDYDSYRNTYIGFIFQEYNILPEFSVGANIALAMELQGRKATNEELNGILKEVDLEGYGNRKPNELSGGQLQRVAIARALVKQPQIIMADEPTGALDSKTGMAVFETLKKLSKEKLVVIVSHDREYAELFGDRVIELADGKIISDIEKYSAPVAAVSSGVSIIDNSIIRIEKGYALSPQDLQLISNYVKNSQVDTFISLNPDTNAGLKRIAKIDNEGNKESFKTTDSDKIQLSTDTRQDKLVKSRLPIAKAVKIGASSLKNKKFRLVMTIFMAIIALALFGLADMMSTFKEGQVAANTLSEIGRDYTSIQKVKQVTYDFGLGEQTEYIHQKMTLDEAKYLQNKFPDSNFKAIYLPSDPNNPYEDEEGYYSEPTMEISSSLYSTNEIYSSWLSLYTYKLYGFVELNSSELSDLGYTSIHGRLPKSDGEIAMSLHVFETFKVAGYSYYDNNIGSIEIKPSDMGTAAEFAAKEPKVQLRGKVFKIVGFVDTNLDLTPYDELTNINSGNSVDSKLYNLYDEFSNEIKYGYHALCFANEGFVERSINAQKSGLAPITSYYSNSIAYMSSLNTYFDEMYRLAALDKNSIIFTDSSKTSLASNEVVVPLSAVEQYANQYLYFDFDSFFNDAVSNAWDAYETAHPGASNEEIEEYISDLSMTDAFFKDVAAAYIDEVSTQTDFLNNTFDLQISDYYDSSSHRVKIVGVYISRDNNYLLAVADSIYNSYSTVKEKLITYVIGKMPSTTSGIREMFDIRLDVDENDMTFSMMNEVVSRVDNWAVMFKMLSKIFLYAGIAAILLSSLLLCNFIMTSIAYKRQEIGILRAVGARGMDVFNIFFSESLIIALINFALGIAAILGLTAALNNMLLTNSAMQLKLLTFTIRQAGIMLGVSVGAAFIASFFPVYFTARKRPMDAIRKR